MRLTARSALHVLPEKARADEKRQRLIQNCSWMCRPPMGALKPDLIVQLDRIQARLRDVVTLEVAMECHPSAARHGLFDDALKHVSRRLNVILLAVQHNFSFHGALCPMDEDALKAKLLYACPVKSRPWTLPEMKLYTIRRSRAYNDDVQCVVTIHNSVTTISPSLACDCT